MTGTCDCSSHNFDIAIRTEQRCQHDVVMHESCAFITKSEKLPRFCKCSSHEISKHVTLVGVRSLPCLLATLFSVTLGAHTSCGARLAPLFRIFCTRSFVFALKPLTNVVKGNSAYVHVIAVYKALT
jgi:hypothetical protein